MAHIHQREVREQRRRRRNALLSVFLLIPLFLAGYFFHTISSAKLTAQTVEEILINCDDHSETITEREPIKRIMNAIGGAKKITQSARPLSEYRNVSLTCADSYTKASYTLCLTDSANDALLVSEEGVLYSLSPEHATALLVSEEFAFLYQSAPWNAEMTLAGETHSIAPAYTWHYTLADGSERTASAEGEFSRYTAVGTLPEFTLYGEPDETKLSVTVGDDVKTGSLASLASLMPETKAEVEITVLAAWQNPEADGYYGSAEYRILLDYTPSEA